MTFAAVLLSSVSAFAQSGNNEPLKGDVNEDGTVDVADITAVIKIMKDNATPQTTYYFSVGTTPVTADNYTTVNNATTTIPSTKEFTNNSGSKSLVYVLVPSNKTVTAIDTYANVSINMVIDNTVTISNHKVYVTDGKIAKGSSLTFTISPQTTYYWYVGHITNAQVESSSALNTIVTNNGTSTTSTIGPSTLIMPTTTGDALVYIYPTVWGSPTIVDSTGYGTGDADIEEFGLISPAGYKVRCWDGDSSVRGKTLSITWVK